MNFTFNLYVDVQTLQTYITKHARHQQPVSYKAKQFPELVDVVNVNMKKAEKSFKQSRCGWQGISSHG